MKKVNFKKTKHSKLSVRLVFASLFFTLAFFLNPISVFADPLNPSPDPTSPSPTPPASNQQDSENQGVPSNNNNSSLTNPNDQTNQTDQNNQNNQNQNNPNGQGNTNNPTTPQDNQNNQNNQNNNNSENQGDQKPATCTSQIGALGWLTCPTTGLLAKGIDALYSIIEGMLNVKPVEMGDNSPVFQIWSYMRNIANICFVIFLLIIIYSQITGYGINNYGIKKSLPRLIITAMIVNLSFLFCAIAVDVSNIFGNGLKDLLAGITENAIQNGIIDSSKYTGFYDLFTTIAAGGIASGLVLAFPGGPLGLLLALIPVILGGIISVVVGLLVLGLRQALVIFLVAISPLAFVLYILPNTEKHFQKWKSTFLQMLFFYPMFSLLFGVTKLAGLLFISSATTPFGTIIGAAVQVLPLFLAANLMKLSNTALKDFSSRLNNLGNKATSGINASFKPLQDINRQKSIENAMKRNRMANLLPWFWGGAMSAGSTRLKARLNDEMATRGDTIKQFTDEDLEARRSGRRILRRDKYGRAVYARKQKGVDTYGRTHYTEFVDPKNKVLEYSYQNKVAKLATLAQRTKTEDALGNMSDYLKANNAKNPYLSQLSKNQFENFIDYKNAESSKRRNDHNTNKAYSEILHKAAKFDGSDRPANLEDYEKFIVSGAGTAAWYVDSGQLTEEERKDRNIALELVAADAVDAYESERKTNITKLTTYMDKLVTRDALRVYDLMFENKSIDGIIAGNNVLARRGDYDKIRERLETYMDTGKLKLDTDDANVLALNLLGFKDASPTLGRLGKFINMETWAYTSGARQTQEITMRQYYTGVVDEYTDVNGVVHQAEPLNADGEKYHTKINFASGIQGTSMNKIERTETNNILDMIKSYDSVDPTQREAIFDAMRPALIPAIASFASGSEQIVNVASMLAGMNRKEWTTGTLEQNVPKITKSATAYSEIKKYLKALNADNVAHMKSDMINAVLHRLIAEHFDFNPNDFSDADRPMAEKQAFEKAKKEAHQEIIDIFNENGVINVLRESDKSVLTTMKPAIRDIIAPYLGYDTNKNNQRNS